LLYITEQNLGKIKQGIEFENEMCYTKLGRSFEL
jgi:hypothetical protein